MDIARRQIHQLMNDEEMRDVHTLAIVLNCKKGSKLYKSIFAELKAGKEA